MTEEEKPELEQPISSKYKYKRLYDLGLDRMSAIDGMLTSGDSPMTVAERVKEEWNQCGTVRIATLEKQISRYRSDVLEPKLKMAADRADSENTTVTAAMKKFRDQVDVMENLNQAINMQWARIQKAYAKEEKKPGNKLDPSINKELRPFTDMCRVLSALQLETGVVRRVPKQIQGFFQNLDSGELAEFQLEMTQNDNTLRALGELKNVLQEAAGEYIDGEYVPVGPELTELSEGDEETVESEPH